MLPTKTLTRTFRVPWLEPQQSDVVTGTGVLFHCKTMLDSDWYVDQSHHEFLQNDAFLLNSLDSSSSSSLPQQHHMVPQKPSFSSFFEANGNGFLDGGFDFGEESCFLASFSGNVPSLNAKFAERRDRAAVRSLYELSPPTLYRKRMERWREAGNLEELELQPPAAEVAERRRKG
ncbi:hypothetical protein PHAVU_004G070150 [Phaseolus vulgaris]